MLHLIELEYRKSQFKEEKEQKDEKAQTLYFHSFDSLCPDQQIINWGKPDKILGATFSRLAFTNNSNHHPRHPHPGVNAIAAIPYRSVSFIKTGVSICA